MYVYVYVCIKSAGQRFPKLYYTQKNARHSPSEANTIKLWQINFVQKVKMMKTGPFCAHIVVVFPSRPKRVLQSLVTTSGSSGS